MLPLSDTIEALESLIPLELICRHDMARIRSIAKWIPALLTYRIGFESLLQPQKHHTDFAIHVASFERGRDILSGLIPESDFPSELFENSEWLRIRKFSKLWADPTTPIYETASVWLEFDVSPHDRALPVPGLLFAMDRTTKKADWICETALPLLFDKAISRKQKENLFRIFRMFESSSAFVGCMLSRPQSSIRLTILNAVSTLPLDIDMDWEPWKREFERIYFNLSEIADIVNISFDIGEDGVLPRIGIELQFSEGEARWKTLLDLLVLEDLCSAQMEDQLLAWQGNSVLQLPHLLWKSCVAKRLNHIKVVWALNQPIQAKAYYGFNYKAIGS